MRMALIGVLVVAFVAVLGTAHAEAGPIRITGVSCHGEWVDVRNASNVPRNLQGFRLFDHNKRHRFDFPSVNVPPRAKVRVWGEGKTGGPVRRWFTGWNSSVWNNDGDRASLVNPNRDVVSRHDCDDSGGPYVPPPPPPGGNCHPSYSPCLPRVPDLDCGDISGSVTVHGPDKYGLDGDGDGVGCE